MIQNERSPDAGTSRAPKMQAHGQRLQRNSSGYRLTAHVLSPLQELILPRLERVRKAGNGWTARCPAHADKTASLSLGEGREGQALIHCFAGCHVADVLAAIGLELRDLYAKPIGDLSPMQRAERRQAMQHASALAAARTLACEGLVIELAARQIEAGEALQHHDRTRLREARERCEAATAALELVR
jgi:hypothetical protein